MELKYGLAVNRYYDARSCLVVNGCLALVPGIIIREQLASETSLYLQKLAKSVIENEVTDVEKHFAQMTESPITFEVKYDDAESFMELGNPVCAKGTLRYAFKVLAIFRMMEKISHTIRNRSQQHDYNCAKSKLETALQSTFLIICLRPVTSRQISKLLHDLYESLHMLEDLRKMDEIYTLSTPFAIDIFYKSLNHGKVTNVFEDGFCLLSNNLVEDSEGSLVINDRLQPIGMIVQSECNLTSSGTYFTLSVALETVIRSFLRKPLRTRERKTFEQLKKPDVLRHAVHIENNGEMGTGVLVKVRNKSFMLTCSHVVARGPESLECRCFHGDIKPNLLWRHKCLNKPFDIAIFEVRNPVCNNLLAEISDIYPDVGDIVYNVGFEILSLTEQKLFNPSVHSGRIVAKRKGFLVSDCLVQNGQSGSPMFNTKGQVIGIFVANLENTERNIIYPNVNFAIPLCEIKPVLEKFVDTKDYRVFNKLIGGNVLTEIWNFELPFFRSKL